MNTNIDSYLYLSIHVLAVFPEALTHPTAGTEYLPVVLVQGNEAGPCIWLTAGIHGSEHAGPLVLTN